jgi:AraC family transcriptional regulator, regulatory protein of adaptative response / DNA-3-methyladenine glycosylase II
MLVLVDDFPLRAGHDVPLRAGHDVPLRAGHDVPLRAGHDDFETCYKAVSSRDARFDGRFVTAVRTTGIYCRPSCPAQTPKRENVSFFPRPAAAAAAGYRACKRCRPDAAPGSPEWDVRGDLAARALRGIEAGVVDSDGISGLARRLNVSERHLHRVLVAEVGVGPLALARTRRAQTARVLIDHTDLSLSSIAFSAGFASIRQFNDVMRAEFGCPPSELRRRPIPTGEAEGTLTLRLQHRRPYAATPLLHWLGVRAVTGIEELDGDVYRRVVDGRIVELQPLPDAGHVLARVQVGDVGHVADLVARCRRLLDLDADPLAVDDVLGADPLLAPAVERHPGMRVPGTVDGFELAVRAVLGQQVSVAAARTFAGRLVEQCGKPLDAPRASLTHTFPTAETVAEHPLDAIGLTRSRVTTLRALAESVASGRLQLDVTADRDEARARLLELPGIGPWTVEYVAMRALRDPDAFPASDLVLRRALDADPARSEAWRPWRAYAAMHLWHGSAALQTPHGSAVTQLWQSATKETT